MATSQTELDIVRLGSSSKDINKARRSAQARFELFIYVRIRLE